MNPASNVHVSVDLTGPEFGHAWRDAGGNVYASVRMGDAWLVFASAEDARAVAHACTEAADALDKLTAASEKERKETWTTS